MKKSKLIILQVLIICSLMCTSVYAAVSATIGVNPTNSTVKPGDTFTVTLSLKNVDSSKKVESVEGYINYNKNVIETLTVDSIQKDDNGNVKIGNEELKVEDLTNKGINDISLSNSYVAFNGNPTSGNDTRIVIDFKDGITSNEDLLKINFKVKSNAAAGTVEDAISYSMFVITAGSEESDKITENIDLTIQSSQSGNDNTTDNPQPEKTLSRIEITKVPTKVSYNEGERFDKSGMVIKAIYSDGSSKEINNYEISPSGSLSTNDTIVTIKYTENNISKETTQTITVSAVNNGSGNNNTTNNNTINNNTTNNNVNNNTVNNNTANNNTSRNQTTNNTTNNSSTNRATTNNSNTDNTTTGKKIPSTGAKMLLLPVIVLAVLAYISYNKYMKYKDI